MRCDHAFDDAGYVLGALPPDERQQFVAHLADCDACRNSVREMAGLPGLLARVDPGDVHGIGGPMESAPQTLLPRLMSAVALDRARARRRRAYSLSMAAVLVVLAMAAVPISITAFRDRGATPGATPGAPQQTLSTLSMHPVAGAVPVQATVGVVDTAWGSTVTLRCSYDKSEYPGKQGYALYAVMRNGESEPIGSWIVGPGESVETSAATRYHRAELRALEIRRTDGAAVLRADL